MLDPERNPRTECKRGCRVAPVPQAIWFANHPSAAAKECWNQQGGRGLVGQSACLVNRRSWVQIPAVPLTGGFSSAVLSWIGGLAVPLRFELHSNCAETQDLVLPTHRARTSRDGPAQGKKLFVGLCGAMDSALDF